MISVSTRSNVLDSPAERMAQRPPFCASGPGGPTGTTPSGVRVGGVLRTPRKVFHVSPLYPDDAGAGIVTINALIGLDGFVTETEVANKPSPALAQAAVEAVRSGSSTRHS